MNHKNYVAYLNSKNKEIILDKLKNHPADVVLKCGDYNVAVIISKDCEYCLTNEGKIAVYNSKSGESEEYNFTFDGEYIYLEA